MTTSQNGWPASKNPGAIGVRPFIVAGVSFPGGIKSGDVATVLGYVMTQFHRRVEKLHPGWCWGYAYRDIRGRATVSNHASGTAVDANAPDHPLGKRNTFTRAQVSEIHKILDEVDNVVRWGGDYSGRADEMHFEIVASAVVVAVVARRLTEEEDDMKPEDWQRLEAFVHKEVGMLAAALLDKDNEKAQAGGSHFDTPRGESLMDVSVAARNHARKAAENTATPPAPPAAPIDAEDPVVPDEG